MDPSQQRPVSSSMRNFSRPGGANSLSPSSAQQPTRNTPLRPTAQRNNSSIRLRRIPSSQALRPSPEELARQRNTVAIANQDAEPSGRRRSSSEPQRMSWPPNLQTDLSRQRTYDNSNFMSPIQEGEQTSQQQSNQFLYVPGETPQSEQPPQLGRLRRASAATRSMLGLRSRAGEQANAPGEPVDPAQAEYDQDIVDLLDVIDPEVSTLTSLVNVQNSLFVPDLGRWLNRRPTYDITRRPSQVPQSSGGRPRVGSDEDKRLSVGAASMLRDRAGSLRSNRSRPGSRAQDTPDFEHHDHAYAPPGEPSIMEQPTPDESQEQDRMGLDRTLSIRSTLSESRYAVLPHGVDISHWSSADREELNDHVRHLLHSRKEGFKRSMRGFKRYVSTPLGAFITIYATLVTLFGAAWVFFLIGWIYVGNKQYYVINVIDNVLVALFALIGDGLIPFRIMDTYHMIFIAHYHRLTWKLRKQKALPNLADKNDLPARTMTDEDLEAHHPQGRQQPAEDQMMTEQEEEEELSVLTPKQQAKLVHHQTKFSKSHTYYKAHETTTHYAFPLRLLIAVVVLLDCHSIFQVALGTYTWSHEDYNSRPEAVTATILSCSITCNILGGILISIGDKRTRKKAVIEKMFRQQLTEQAIHKMEKRHEKAEERLASVQEKQNESAEQSDNEISKTRTEGSLEAARAEKPGPLAKEVQAAPSSPGRVEMKKRRFSLGKKDKETEPFPEIYEGT